MAPDRRLLIPLQPYATKTATPKTWAPADLNLTGGRYYSDPANVPSGSEDYREDVYGGPPSKYFDPDLTSNGAGTSGDPYQISQLSSSTVSAGDIVGALPGSRRLPDTGSSETPAFNPNVNGTLMSRITYVGQKDPGSMANPLTDATRTEIGHLGSGHQSGCPQYRPNDYTTLDSIVHQYANGPWLSDRGCVYMDEAIGARLIRMHFEGTTLPDLPSNFCAIWNDDSDDLVVQDCTFRTLFANNTSANCSFIILYAAKNYDISNNHFEDGNAALYVKGAPADVYNYGSYRRNRLLDLNKGWKMQALHASNISEFSQNLITGIVFDGITFGEGNVGDCRNLILRNNTLVLASSDSAAYHSDDAPRTGTGWQNGDNIIQLSGGNGHFVNLSSSTNTLTRWRNNLYYRASGTQRWTKGSTWNSIVDMQSGLQAAGQPADCREENSQHANPLLDGTFHPGVGSPALTMGTAFGYGGAGGEIGCYAGGATVGRRTA